MLNLGKLPPNVTITINRPEKPFDIIQVFVNSKKELEKKLSPLKTLLVKNGILWVTYPKGIAKAKTDINRDSIREHALTLGLQAVSLVAVDEKWSALRLKTIS
jgi:ABC-type Fe2+-enterobactin transport system substrate-binding protein